MGHKFNAGFWWTFIAGSAMLTGMALSEDQANLKHGAALEEANWQAERVIEIANKEGIPPTGAVALLRQDHQNLGRRLFATHCSSCHRYNGTRWPASRWKTLPRRPTWRASEAWSGSHACSIMTITTEDKYFGGTKFKDGTMARKVFAKYTEEEKALLPDIARLLADGAKLPYEEPLEEERRRTSFLYYNDDLDFEDGRSCIECHDIDSEDEGSWAPGFDRIRIPRMAGSNSSGIPRTIVFTEKRTTGCPAMPEMGNSSPRRSRFSLIGSDPLQQNFSFMDLIHLWGFTFLPLK